MINPWVLLQNEGHLSDDAKRSLLHAYRERGEKAIFAAERGNVKRYRDFWVVVGRTDEYIVEDGFCTCDDFLYRGGECWHSIALRIAQICKLYEEFDLWYEQMTDGSPDA